MRGNNYINDRLKSPKYAIYLNGKEVKRLPFQRQAIQYAQKENGTLFGDKIEVVNIETSEIIFG